MANATEESSFRAEALAKIALLEEALLAEREARRAVEAERDRMSAERDRMSAERDRMSAERDRVRTAYQEQLIAIELLLRRIQGAKAERVDTTQLELEFEARKKELDQLTGGPGASAASPPATSPPATSPKRKPTGRRDLSKVIDAPEERVEVTDPEMERLVAEGKAERFGFDTESSAVKWKRGGPVRLVVVRTKYRLGKLEGITSSASASEVEAAAPVESAQGEHQSAPAEQATEPVESSPAESASRALDSSPQDGDSILLEGPPPGIDRRFGTTLVTSGMPPSIIRGAMGTPSLYANIIHEKFRRGMPFYRQEQQMALDGLPLDRATMCRWTHLCGIRVGPLIDVMRVDAKRAFCIATDATHVLVQPAPREDKKRQPCKTGHFFAVVADRDHVLFEYTEKEDSKAVMRIFRGYEGHVQADAKSVYNILFRPPDEPPPDDPELASDGKQRDELGCWSHARRKFFECALTSKELVAKEALFRIARLFEYEEEWRALGPAQRKAMRQMKSHPELESFFAWGELEWTKVQHQRGLLRTALGYARNQREALMEYLTDGRLEMDNNRTEREIKNVVMGRKAWLFVGSDDHGVTTANLLSLVASAKLHGLDDEQYLRDLFRVLPFWPEARLLELAPKHWRATRERIEPRELQPEIGWITVPPTPLDMVPAASAATP